MVLPTVLVSSVVRAANKGDSHGGLYIVDMERGTHEQVIDWSRTDISWDGRGRDRGLRGIVVKDGLVYMAASDELFVYDRNFRLVDSFRNRYLKHCHEMCADDNHVYVASTGYDSVLRFDPARGVFDSGVCLRGWTNGWSFPARWFDPCGRDGPEIGDTLHLNNVQFSGGSLYASGRRCAALVRVKVGSATPIVPVPFGTHNVQLCEGLVLFNHTNADCVVLADRFGRVVRRYPVPAYDGEDGRSAVQDTVARPGFGRGLCRAAGGIFVAGSSPSTVAAYDIDGGTGPVRTVRLSKDVRNAAHGLTIWPDPD